MRWIVGVIAVVTGCGDNITVPNLELDAPFTPIFATYRVGAGPWQVPHGTAAANGHTTYELPIDDDFELVVACESDTGNGNVFAQEMLGTVDDWDAVVAFERCPVAPIATSAFVTGQVVGDGLVFADNAETFASPVYDLIVPTGPLDLVAFDDAGALVTIRHDLNIVSEDVEPDIDFTSEGRALRAFTPTITGAHTGYTVQAATYLETKNGTWAVLPGGIVPGAMLEAGDTHWFVTTATSPTGTGYVAIEEQFVESAQLTYAFLPPLTSIAFGAGASVSWHTLPAGFSGAQLVVSDLVRVAFVTAGAGWLAEHGAGGLSFDAEVPGLDPSWLVTSTAGGQQLTVVQLGGDASQGDHVWSSTAVGSWGISE